MSALSCLSRLRPFLIIASIAHFAQLPAFSQSGEGPFYRVHALPESPNGEEANYSMDLNARGDVLGQELVDGVETAYVWLSSTQEFVSVAVTGACRGAHTRPLRMNDENGVIGVLFGNSCPLESWIWTPQSGGVLVSDLPDSPGSSCFVGALNNRGAIAGTCPPGPGLFLWDSSSGTHDIPTGTSQPYEVADLNERDWLVANESLGDATATYLWSPETGYVSFADFPYEDINFVNYSNAINATGHIVGGATWFCGNIAYDLCIYPFIWTPEDGVELLLEAAPAAVKHVRATALGINAHDVVIGTTTWDGLPRAQAFIWDRNYGLRFLHERFDPCAIRQGPLGVRAVHAINDAGQVLASRQVGRSALLFTPYLRGDLDENRVVELSDVSTLLTSFGQTGGMSYGDGDLDCDEDVDLQDLAILLGNFGEALP